MSVPVSKRGKRKLAVITQSRQLAAYTLKITQSEKNFPKCYRAFINDKIVEPAIEISSLVYSANRIKVVNVYDYADRRALQQKAIDLSYAFLNNMAIWYSVHGIQSNRIDYWSGLVMEFQRLAESWRDADFERYKKQLNDPDGHRLECACYWWGRSANNANNAYNCNTSGANDNNNANNTGNAAVLDCVTSRVK